MNTIAQRQLFIFQACANTSPNIPPANMTIMFVLRALRISQFQAPTSPPGRPPGKFFKVVKNPPPGQNFSAKARPPGQEIPTPGEYCERSSQLFLLVGVEILEFCRNQTLKRTGRLFKSYPLVSV